MQRRRVVVDRPDVGTITRIRPRTGTRTRARAGTRTGTRVASPICARAGSVDQTFANFDDELKAAVEQGLIPVSAVDQAVSRILFQRLLHGSRRVVLRPWSVVGRPPSVVRRLWSVVHGPPSTVYGPS